MTNPVLVEVLRGPRVESAHRGAVCVVDADGATVLALGDVAHPVFPRSAVKALQALPLVESGAADRYRLDFVWLALRIALECDGRKFHEFQRSRTRGRHLGAGGWRVLPVTWDDVTRRWPQVLAELTAALADAAA